MEKFATQDESLEFPWIIFIQEIVLLHALMFKLRVN